MTRSIFLSYSREDQETVRELQADFSSMGNHVFFDQELSGGQSWWSSLLEQVRRCDVFVPVVGGSWLDSLPCQLETDYAQKLGKRFLPVVLADVSANLLPPSIAETQWVMYERQNKESLLSLVRAITSLDPSRSLPDPLPEPPPVPISYLTDLRERVQVRHDISRHDQDLLLAEIRRRIEASKDVDDLRIILENFRGRDDLNVHVATEIDRLFQSIGRQNTPAPTYVPPQPSPRPQSIGVQQPPSPASSPREAQNVAGSGAPVLPSRAEQWNDSKVTASYVLSASSLFCFPILLGPLAIWLAHSERKIGNPRAATAFNIAVAATAIGLMFYIFILGVSAAGGG